MSSLLHPLIMDVSQSTTPSAARNAMKHACVSCARRKIRCDRRQPCSNCVAHARTPARRSRRYEGTAGTGVELDVGCVYVEPPPAQRHRRKVALTPTLAGDLIDRLRMYEDLLQKNDIVVPDALSRNEETHLQQSLPQPLSREGDDGSMADDHLWIPSPWEAKMAVHKDPTSTSTAQTPPSASETLVVSDTSTNTTESWPIVVHEDAAEAELDLWQSMPPEVSLFSSSHVYLKKQRNVHVLTTRGKTATQSPRVKHLCAALLWPENQR